MQNHVTHAYISTKLPAAVHTEAEAMNCTTVDVLPLPASVADRRAITAEIEQSAAQRTSTLYAGETVSRMPSTIGIITNAVNPARTELTISTGSETWSGTPRDWVYTLQYATPIQPNACNTASC